MKKKQWIFTIIGIVLMFGNGLFPSIPGLSDLGETIICVLLGTMCMMIFVDLTWPVLLCILALSCYGVYPIGTAFSLSFGHYIFWFVAFSGIVMHAMNREGLLRRLAMKLISFPFVRRSPWLFLTALFAACLLIGSIMDVTAVCLLFTAITEEILTRIGVKRGSKFGQMVMIGIMVFCGVSYGITPLGHSVSLLAIALLEQYCEVNIMQYCLVGYICGFVILAIFMLVLRFGVKLDVSCLQDFDPRILTEHDKPVSKRERACAWIYGAIIFTWIAPSFIQNAFPAVYSAINSMTVIMPIMVGIIVMTLLSVEGRPLIDFKKELVEGVPWRACFPMAVAMIFSNAVSLPEAGISEFLAETLTPVLGGLSPMVFVVLITFISIIITACSSDTIACTIACSITVSLISAGLLDGINHGALAVLIGCTSCCAFSTPAGSTYAAIVSGQGWVKGGAQFIYGSCFAIICELVFCFVGYQLATLLIV